MILAWGAKLPPAERERLLQVAAELGCDPSHLSACIQFESRWDPAAVNATTGATGLIQFMPRTAQALGTTVEALRGMTRLQQLDYVLAYLRPYAGRLRTLSDCYMAILWPRAVGEPEDYVVFADGSAAYAANAALDVDRNRAVTKAEAAAFPARRLAEGLLPENASPAAQEAAEAAQPAATSSPSPASVEPPSGPPVQPQRPFNPEQESSMAPILLAPILQLIPQLISAFGKGERATKNAAAATAVVDAFTRAVPDAVNTQDAIEKAAADPAVLNVARAAVLSDPVVLALQEVGGGIAAARQRDDVAITANAWYRPLLTPSFIIALVLLGFVGFVLWNVATDAGGLWRPEDRSQVLMLSVAVVSAVMGYYLGSSLGSARKDDLLTQRNQ